MPFEIEESGCSVCISNVIMISVLPFFAAVIKIILAEPVEKYNTFYSALRLCVSSFFPLSLFASSSTIPPCLCVPQSQFI